MQGPERDSCVRFVGLGFFYGSTIYGAQLPKLQ
jgi:hypothetical protein